MAEKEYTNGDAVDIIENEGVGYAVQHYVSGSWFKDDTTERLWTNAANALELLQDYLRKDTGRDF